jgi:hypothetical protein
VLVYYKDIIKDTRQRAKYWEKLPCPPWLHHPSATSEALQTLFFGFFWRLHFMNTSEVWTSLQKCIEQKWYDLLLIH